MVAYKAKMNPLGVNVSDVWSDIYPVRHKNSKNRKYNELSVKLLDRIISMSTNEGDTVFDPFGGSGTTFAVAQMLKRRWIGCELGDCNAIVKRLQNPVRDQEQLSKVREESAAYLQRNLENYVKKNGFWVCSDYEEDKDCVGGMQTRLYSDNQPSKKEVFKINEMQSLGPDWQTFGATIFSGVITVLATMAAVIYTNRKSNVQLKAQEEKYALERKQQFQQSKYVVLKPTLLLMPLFGLLDRLIV